LDEGLGEFRRFTGRIGAGDNELAIHFKARIDERGEIEIDFPVLPYDRQTVFIRSHDDGASDEVRYFKLDGVSEDGTTFESEHAHVARHSTRSDGETGENTLELDFACSHGTFRRALKEAAPAPCLMHRLKGFECFRRPAVECRLGTVVAAGPTKLENPDTLSGWFAVQARDIPPDLEAWRADAEQLLNHVRRVMSFAAAIHLKSPVLEFAAGQEMEVTVYSQDTQYPATMRTFHILGQDDIFQAAVRSFFEPPVDSRDLFFAFEWYAMPSTYNEVRLVNAMTTLESLVASNTSEEEALIQPKKVFDKSRRALRRVIEQCLEKWPEGRSETALQELNEKLGDLNRRSFRRKLDRLAEKWGVPLDGIPPAAITAAIRARNAIVHSGHHAVDTEDERLWEHMTVVRELAVRFLLTALGFKGQYISHLGGFHHATFPPVLSEDAPDTSAPPAA